MQPEKGSYLDSHDTNMWLTTCGRGEYNGPVAAAPPPPEASNGSGSGGKRRLLMGAARTGEPVGSPCSASGGGVSGRRACTAGTQELKHN